MNLFSYFAFFVVSEGGCNAVSAVLVHISASTSGLTDLERRTPYNVATAPHSNPTTGDERVRRSAANSCVGSYRNLRITP